MARNDDVRCTELVPALAWDQTPMVDENGEIVKRRCPRLRIPGATKCAKHHVSEDHAVELPDRVSRVAQELLDRFEVKSVSPMDGLLDAVRMNYAMVKVLSMLTGQLPLLPDYALVKVDPGQEDAFRATLSLYGLDSKGDGAPHVLMKLYGEWLDRYTRTCKIALDAGLEERMVRRSEFESAQLLSAVQAGLDAATLTPDQEQAFKVAMATSIRQVLALS